MLCRLLFLCGILWLLPACAATGSAGSKEVKPAWLDYATVMEKGVRAEKPVMLYFRAKWCYFCKEMEQYVFTKPQVARSLRSDVLAVRLDVGTENRVSELYSVKHLPTIVMLDRHGREVFRTSGYMSADTLLAALQYMKERRHREMDFNTYLKGRM